MKRRARLSVWVVRVGGKEGASMDSVATRRAVPKVIGGEVWSGWKR